MEYEKDNRRRGIAYVRKKRKIEGVFLPSSNLMAHKENKPQSY